MWLWEYHTPHLGNEPPGDKMTFTSSGYSEPVGKELLNTNVTSISFEDCDMAILGVRLLEGTKMCQRDLSQKIDKPITQAKRVENSQSRESDIMCLFQFTSGHERLSISKAVLLAQNVPKKLRQHKKELEKDCPWFIVWEYITR